MPSWDPRLYLRFGRERIQPCVDLARRAADVIASPGRVIDLGCGPGNSTAVLRRTFPDAQLVGVDNSESMLVQARGSGLNATWQHADITDWMPDAPVDLLFSNAALQWVPDHAALFPRLLDCVASGGVLAVQLPYHLTSPVHRIIADVAARFDAFDDFSDGLTVHAADRYYDWLAPHAASVAMWRTTYHHVLADADAVVAWISGSGLRPYLEHLERSRGADERDAFLASYAAAIRAAYPPAADGKVIFEFPRLFVIAVA